MRTLSVYSRYWRDNNEKLIYTYFTLRTSRSGVCTLSKFFLSMFFFFFFTFLVCLVWHNYIPTEKLQISFPSYSKKSAMDSNIIGIIVGAATTIVSGAFVINEYAFGPPSRQRFTTTTKRNSNVPPNPNAAPGVECPCRDPRFDAACVGVGVGIALLIYFKNQHIKSIKDEKKKY